MLPRLLTTALFAGFLTGLLAAVLQLLFVQPVLLQAELYESGALTHFGATSSPATGPGFSFDPMRDGLSVLFTAFIYVGYALLLVAVMALTEDRGHTITIRSGLIWGIAGFIAVQLAPAIGLPPELPGASAAEVAPRQVWWFATVFVTGLGLWLIAFGRGWAQWGVAIALLLLPHIIGAPHPDTFAGPTPPELAALFGARALGVGLAAWATLGLLAAYFWEREG